MCEFCQQQWRQSSRHYHHRFVAMIVIFLMVFTTNVSPHLNLYLTKSEVKRLFGLDAELFYVREGVVNTYALSFTVPVHANLTKLFFTWQGLTKKPMPYLAQVEYDNGDAMALPTLNISTTGTVPMDVSTFSLTLPCSGASNAEIEVNLLLNVTSLSKNQQNNNVTRLKFKRRKICHKGEIFLPRNESIYQEPTWLKTPLSTLYIAMVVAFTATVLIITFASLIYLRIKRSKERQPLNCRYYSGPNYLGVDSSCNMGGLRRVPGMSGTSVRSNSYATIASLKKYPLPSSPKTETLPYNGLGSKSLLDSVHYASSPLSHLYSQMHSEGCSPTHSLLNSRLSNSSWCSPSSFRSQSTWKDPRQNDPTDRIRQLTVDRWRVIVGDLIQEGTFGRIHQGVCHDPVTQKALNVVVKTVSGDSSSAQARLVLREGLFLSGFHHPHLFSVLGVCTQDIRRPLLLYPQEDQNNLKLHLRGGILKGVSFEGKKLLTRDAVQVAIGVCHGLMHLHTKRILHKDVATRNCVVDKNIQVKITDTALARDLFPQDYHCLGDNENRPIKWLSLEAVLHNKFTAATDVWMFGVLLWELMTSAQQPYIEIDPFEMAAYLRDGYRLSQPHSCPDDLFGVMAICWAPSPEDRPSLANLSSCLEEFHSALSTFV